MGLEFEVSSNRLESLNSGPDSGIMKNGKI